jgi:hypothetical protein
MRATTLHSDDQVDKLEKARAPASAVLAAQTRGAKEFLPLAERAQKDARTYLSRSTQLDPMISALARLVSEHPESAILASPVRDAIDEAMEKIREDERHKENPGYHGFDEAFGKFRHLGRIFQKCAAIMSNNTRIANEGNDIVKRWDAELRNPLVVYFR